MSDVAVLKEQHRLSEQLHGVLHRIGGLQQPGLAWEGLLDAAVQEFAPVHAAVWEVGERGLCRVGASGPLPDGAAWPPVDQTPDEQAAYLMALCRAPEQLTGEQTEQVLWPLCLDGAPLGLLQLEFPQGRFVSAAQQRFLDKLTLYGAATLGHLLARQREHAAFAELQQSEERSRRLLQESPVPILSSTLGGRLTGANDAALKLLGYTHEDFALQVPDWATLLPPEHMDGAQAAFEQAVRTGRSDPAEKEVLTSGGERVPVDAFLVRDGDGEAGGLVCYLRDLRSERSFRRLWSTRATLLQSQVDQSRSDLARQAEELRQNNLELEARTRVLEGFAELTRHLTLHTDPYRLIGHAQEFTRSLLPQTFALYYEPEGGLWRVRSQVGDLGSPALQEALDAGLPYHSSVYLLVPWQSRQPYYTDHYALETDPALSGILSPQEMPVETVATLPVLVHGEVRGVFALGLNVAQPWTQVDRVIVESVVHNLGLALERAEQAQALQQRTRELERSNAELEQFAFVASHDLQEPLRSVSSFAQLLALRFGDSGDPRVARYVSYITEGTERMRLLIDDLLTFSRIGSRPRPFVPVLLDTQAAQASRELAVPLADRGGTLNIGPLPQVLGDPAQLRLVLSHLLDNALKFSSPARPPQVEVSARRGGQWVTVTVQDNGIGIEKRHFEQVFTIFQRLHSRERYAGNGIGLPLVRKIVERHGGQVTLDSVPGEGTRVAFTLRAAADDPGSD
ncbi:ATP-binding protein [Deinococcus sp. Leaf326]|uniref:PAS domain-containing sensor histidine kinase n=1 Tax=Deinococcus sp. Leaf326 TaxID=1736338 RepID=UPI0006F26B5B|nr:ATP-binding protein [Deinococcus sp. Leaf326]KQR01015.1 hypothetical protein ASF71_12685 [Deinococcus sp. Leaf326]